MSAPAASLQDWLGRQQTCDDVLHPAAAAAMAATLDRDDPPVDGDPLPPLWHWLYTVPVARQRELGPDGHPRRGGFLPPVRLPRRMWAGGRFVFHHPLRIGERVTRRSTVAAIRESAGRSGPLVFVTVRHEIANAAGVALTEEQDIVYRGEPAGGTAPVPQDAPADETFSRTIVADPVMLFRYSALTFNGHRIHYDRAYATGVEHYPGLVVHGPLIATLLCDIGHRQRPDATITRFEFRAVHPLFDGHPFSICGRSDGADAQLLWARDPQGRLAMRARLECAA